jgi:pyrophosphatase PpaX
MSKLKALLFDLDGTLRDTREVLYPAIQHAVTVHTGKTPSRKELAPYMHHHKTVHEQFATDVDFSAFYETFYEMVKSLRPSSQRPYADVGSVLKRLHSHGYRLALVTSASTATSYVAEQGLAKLFDVIVGGNDTTEHKPSPIPIEYALEGLKLQPSDVIMVGDLPADIDSAKNAKVRASIGITHGFGTRKMLEVAHADYIIDSFSELEDVIKKIEAL